MQEQRDLREIANHFKEKLQKIKVLAFDVDGVLTNGQLIFFGGEVGWNRSFHTRDGYMMKELIRQGYKVGVITGGDSRGVFERFGKDGKGLGLDFIFAGDEDKRASYKKVKELGFTDEQILYVGDEFFDLPVLKECGFSVTVPEASHEVKESVDYVTQTAGGMGAAREVMDIFRYANNIKPKVPGLE